MTRELLERVEKMLVDLEEAEHVTVAGPPGVGPIGASMCIICERVKPEAHAGGCPINGHDFADLLADVRKELEQPAPPHECMPGVRFEGQANGSLCRVRYAAKNTKSVRPATCYRCIPCGRQITAEHGNAKMSAVGEGANGNGNGHRDAKGHWLPGQTPNPGGRPKGLVAEIRDTLGPYGPKALLRLAELAGLVDGADPAAIERDRIACLGMVLDRAYGRPSQALTNPDGSPLFTAQPASTSEAILRLAERGLLASAPVN